MEKNVFRIGISPVESNKKIGPIRSHLYNYAFAKNELIKNKDTKIIFRVDDTNTEKHNKNLVKNIFDFFKDNLNFYFDIDPYNSENKINQSVFQSERIKIYLENLKYLLDKKVAIFDKQKELFLFDTKYFVENFTNIIRVVDLIRGEIYFDLEEDLKRGYNFFPLFRSDLSVLYHFASVIDDKDFEITHIVRGQDKISAIPYQEMIRIVFGLKTPFYLHTPLLLNDKDIDTYFNNLIKKGISYEALISYIISSGYGDPDEIWSSLNDFIKNFNYKKIHKKDTYFDYKKLENINNRILKKTSKESHIKYFLEYLVHINEFEFLEKIKINDDLKNLIFLFKKTNSETLNVLKSIFDPIYEDYLEYDKENILKLIEDLRQNDFDFLKIKQENKKQNYDHIRWILVGQKNFSNIEYVYDYLKKYNFLEKRLDLVKNLILEKDDQKYAN